MFSKTCKSYSENQKTCEQEDDFYTQDMTLNSPMDMRHSNCAGETDPFYLIRDIISYK